VLVRLRLYALFAFVLPTLLVVSAGFFALATATRR
jgi:hypothetical protein